MKGLDRRATKPVGDSKQYAQIIAHSTSMALEESYTAVPNFDA